MGPVVVAVDVAADPAAGLVERHVFVQPHHLPFFQFSEPALSMKGGRRSTGAVRVGSSGALWFERRSTLYGTSGVIRSDGSGSGGAIR